MEKTVEREGRRNFFVTLTGAVAGGATLVATLGKPGVLQERTAESSSGYRLTEHVRHYYRTIKV